MTVTELSRITGYSISTVSKALSDSKEIGAEAKEKILTAAMETGYYKKAVKHKRRIGAPKTICIVCDEYSDFRVLRNLSRELEKYNFKTVITINADAADICEHLGIDRLLFFRREPFPCSLPFVVFSGDIYDTVEKLIKEEYESEYEFSENDGERARKKEDIWLF